MPAEAMNELLEQPVLCEPGCSILEKENHIYNAVGREDPCLDNPRLYMQRALDAATRADVVVMMLGEHSLQSGESGSRADISAGGADGFVAARA